MILMNDPFFSVAAVQQRVGIGVALNGELSQYEIDRRQFLKQRDSNATELLLALRLGRPVDEALVLAALDLAR